MPAVLQVQVLYFASVREALGEGERVASGAVTLAQLRDELAARGGAYARALGRDRVLRVALDQVLCEESAALHDNAEVAFFPPVTGG